MERMSLWIFHHCRLRLTACRHRFSDHHTKDLCVYCYCYEVSEPDGTSKESLFNFRPAQIGFIISLHKWKNNSACTYPHTNNTSAMLLIPSHRCKVKMLQLKLCDLWFSFKGFLFGYKSEKVCTLRMLHTYIHTTMLTMDERECNALCTTAVNY